MNLQHVFILFYDFFSEYTLNNFKLKLKINLLKFHIWTSFTLRMLKNILMQIEQNIKDIFYVRRLYLLNQLSLNTSKTMSNCFIQTTKRFLCKMQVHGHKDVCCCLTTRYTYPGVTCVI